MEAMATGMPVVSTFHSGIPELVEDGRSGFLVAERDIETLAACMGQFIEKPELFAEMGRAGRRFVEEHHNVATLNCRLVALYRQLLAGAV
jgi:colanic acid/amylovoran biosynthesis glycosyltransferase